MGVDDPRGRREQGSLTRESRLKRFQLPRVEKCDLFDAVGGFCEGLPLNYNDMDFCLKLDGIGRRNVYDPDTILYHFESSSRDTEVAEWEKDLLRGRWAARTVLDPSTNPHLTHVSSMENLLGKHPTAEQRKLFSNELQITKETPPALLVHAADDDIVPVGNSIEFFSGLQVFQTPASMHI